LKYIDILTFYYYSYIFLYFQCVAFYDSESYAEYVNIFAYMRI